MRGFGMLRVEEAARGSGMERSRHPQGSGDRCGVMHGLGLTHQAHRNAECVQAVPVVHVLPAVGAVVRVVRANTLVCHTGEGAVAGPVAPVVSLRASVRLLAELSVARTPVRAGVESICETIVRQSDYPPTAVG